MSAADELTTVSRAFYEEARWKMATSIIVAAGSMLMLGLCAITGGLSSSEKILYDSAYRSGDSREYHQALGVGYGFACFFFVLGFVLLFAASIYLSPVACGSRHEKLTLKSPLELASAKRTKAIPK